MRTIDEHGNILDDETEGEADYADDPHAPPSMLGGLLQGRVDDEARRAMVDLTERAAPWLLLGYAAFQLYQRSQKGRQ